MKSLALTLAALTTALTVCAAAQEKAAYNARQELTARYAGISRSFEKKDAAGVLEPMLPDYTLKQPNGTVIKRDAIAADMTRQMKAMQHAKWVRKIESLDFRMSEAVAKVRGTFDATVPAQDSSGKPHKFHMSTLVNDTWVRKGKAWMLKSTQVVANKVEIDGKPAGPPR